MLIKIFKQRTLQVNQFEPVSFGYGLESDPGKTAPTLKETETVKKDMEKIVDEWLEIETKKWESYKKKGSGNAVTPISQRSPF